jgi:hypothetical protein
MPKQKITLYHKQTDQRETCDGPYFNVRESAIMLAVSPQTIYAHITPEFLQEKGIQRFPHDVIRLRHNRGIWIHEGLLIRMGDEHLG